MSAQLLVDKSSVPTTSTTQLVSSDNPQLSLVCALPSAVLSLLLLGLAVFGKLKLNKLEKNLKFEQFRSREAQKKLNLALETIRQIETNPDLINSRELNLDYLRMRMAEDMFNFAIVSQIKAKVKDKVSEALRRPYANRSGIVGMATSGQQINEIIEVEYEAGIPPHTTKCVLFRVQIRLVRLPDQTTSTIVKQVIDCIETYLSPSQDYNTWQPMIQDRLVYIHWDQKAKPTPMLVMEQSTEGINVSLRTKQRVGANLTLVEKEGFA